MPIRLETGAQIFTVTMTVQIYTNSAPTIATHRNTGKIWWLREVVEVFKKRFFLLGQTALKKNL